MSDLVVAAILEPVDASGDVRPVYVTDQRRLIVQTAHLEVAFRGILAEGLTIRRRATAWGEFLGASSPPEWSLQIDLTQGDLEGWSTWTWEGAPVRLLVAEHGDRSTWEDYREILVGRVADPPTKTGDTLTVRGIGPQRELDEPISTDVYRALGGGLLVPSGATGSATGKPAMETVGGLTLELFVELLALPAGEIGLWHRGTHYGLVVSATGELGAILEGTVYQTGWAVEVGIGWWCALVVDPSWTTARVYARQGGDDVALVWSGTCTAVTQSGTTSINGRSGNHGGFRLDEIRLWDGPRSLADLIQDSEAPFEDWSGLPLRALWRAEELTGTTMRDVIQGLNVTLTGTSWDSSRSGDDPAEHGGSSLAGQTKPWAWGRCHNLKLHCVDGPRGLWQWAGHGSFSIERLYIEGVPLATDHVMTAATGGDFAIDDDGVLSCVSAYTFRPFVPGQVTPPFTGQDVEISGWPSYNGTYTCLTVSQDGLTMTLDSLPTGPASCPAAAVIRTPAGDEVYATDYARSIVEIDADVEAEVTADVIALTAPGGSHRASDAIEHLAPGADVELAWDPSVALYVPLGQSTTPRELLDRVVRSVAGWCAERRDGSLMARQWGPPVGPPVALILTTKLAQLSGGYYDDPPPLLGVIKDRPELLSPATPPPRISVQYRQAHAIQSADALAGMVSPARRRWLSEGWLLESRALPQYPYARPAEPVDVDVYRQGDARQWLTRAEWVFGRRLFYRLQALGLPVGALELGDVVLVESPYDEGLRGGALAIVSAITESTAEVPQTLEVIL